MDECGTRIGIARSKALRTPRTRTHARLRNNRREIERTLRHMYLRDIAEYHLTRHLRRRIIDIDR